MASVRASGEDVMPAAHAAPTTTSIFPTISVAGNIGAGKTTLAKAMARVLGRRYVCEPYKANAYFADFYADKKRYALPAQLEFMLHRIEHHQELYGTHGRVRTPALADAGAPADTWVEVTKRSRKSKAEPEPEPKAAPKAPAAKPPAEAAPTAVEPFVQDRSAFEDRVFANRMAAAGDMTARDLNLYDRFFDVFALAHGEELPSAIVYLAVDPEVLLERVRARGRVDESIDLEYLKSFVGHYGDFLADMADTTNVFVVEWDATRDTSDAAMDVVAADLLAHMQAASPSGTACGRPINL